MKKIVKIMGIIIVAIIMLETNVNAFTVDAKTTLDVTEYGYLPIHYIGEEKGEYEILKYEGEPVYLNNRVVQDNNVIMSSTYKWSNDKIADILLNGYPAKTYEELGLESEEEAYFATQEALFAYKENKDIGLYVAEDEQGERILKCIEKLLKSTQEELIELVEVDDEWKVLEDNDYYLYKNYYISSDYGVSNVKFYTSEEAFVYSQDNKLIQNISVGETFKFVVPRNAKGTYELHASFNRESYKLYAMFNMPEVTKSYYIVKYEESDDEVEFEITINDIALGTIINYDAETNEPIAGSKFNVLDKDGKVIMSNLTTDKNGKVIFGVEPGGEYFLKQIKTKDGYNIMEETISFTGKENNDITFNVYNSKVDENQETINTSSTQINVSEETKNVVENDVTDITNIKTTNIVRDVTKQTNVTNFAKNNYITNTTYLKNINQVTQNNTYDNSIWKESVANYTIEGTSETKNITRDDYMTYIDFIKSANTEAPNLPVAVKE